MNSEHVAQGFVPSLRSPPWEASSVWHRTRQTIKRKISKISALSATTYYMYCDITTTPSYKTILHNHYLNIILHMEYSLQHFATDIKTSAKDIKSQLKSIISSAWI